MLSKRIPLAALCLAALVACDAADSVTGPSGPNLSGGTFPPIEVPPIEKPPVEEFLPGVPVLDPFSPHHKQGAVEFARGDFFWSIPATTFRRDFAFVAVNHADGTTSGQYQLDNPQTGLRENGIVTCLVVDGNEAWIGGMITDATLPGREGTSRIFRVIDGPDQASVLADSDPLGITCQARPPFPTQDIEGGSIEVQDAA